MYYEIKILKSVKFQNLQKVCEFKTNNPIKETLTYHNSDGT